jgi:hypothetical protein
MQGLVCGLHVGSCVEWVGRLVGAHEEVLVGDRRRQQVEDHQHAHEPVQGHKGRQES